MTLIAVFLAVGPFVERRNARAAASRRSPSNAAQRRRLVSRSGSRASRTRRLVRSVIGKPGVRVSAVNLHTVRRSGESPGTYCNVSVLIPLLFSRYDGLGRFNSGENHAHQAREVVFAGPQRRVNHSPDHLRDNRPTARVDGHPKPHLAVAWIQLEAPSSQSPIGPIQVVQGPSALLLGCVDTEIRHAKQHGPVIVRLEAQLIRSMARSDRAAYLANTKEMRPPLEFAEDLGSHRDERCGTTASRRSTTPLSSCPVSVSSQISVPSSSRDRRTIRC